jgi:hypothetical protein
MAQLASVARCARNDLIARSRSQALKLYEKAFSSVRVRFNAREQKRAAAGSGLLARFPCTGRSGRSKSVRCASSGGVSVVRELLDVVHEAVQLPLRIDLGAASQGEPIEALVRAQMRKHGLHRSEPLRTRRAAFGGVDPVAHEGRVIHVARADPTVEERHIPDGRRLRRPSGGAGGPPRCGAILRGVAAAAGPELRRGGSPGHGAGGAQPRRWCADGAPMVHGRRRWLCERFPYAVVYRAAPDGTIRVLAVAHHRRRPGYGRSRTEPTYDRERRDGAATCMYVGDGYQTGSRRASGSVRSGTTARRCMTTSRAAMPRLSLPSPPLAARAIAIGRGPWLGRARRCPTWFRGTRFGCSLRR